MVRVPSSLTMALGGIGWPSGGAGRVTLPSSLCTTSNPVSKPRSGGGGRITRPSAVVSAPLGSSKPGGMVSPAGSTKPGIMIEPSSRISAPAGSSLNWVPGGSMMPGGMEKSSGRITPSGIRVPGSTSTLGGSTRPS